MNLCTVCTNPSEQKHHIARPTNAMINTCGRCNHKQEDREHHSGAFDRGATPIGALIEQLASLPAGTDPVLVVSLVASRTVLALASGERTGARPIANRTAIRDGAPRRDPEALMRELLRAMSQSLSELGLREQAELARALSAAEPSERFGERARELLVLAPRVAQAFADTQAGLEPDLAFVEGFFGEARSLLQETMSAGGRST
jgi:hypothetical protein